MGRITTSFESERPVTTPALCDIRWLGRIEYAACADLQVKLTAERLHGDIPDTLLLLEHPPTITLGRRAHADNILAESAFLIRDGIAVVQSDRGGDVTYHGPGQLVGYPIINLNEPPHAADLHVYLRNLEEVLIRTLAHFEIGAGRFAPHTGVWIDLDKDAPLKIAAIGIKVSRWITSHGFALNVCPSMNHFETIVPCGIREYGVTSIEQYLHAKITIEEVRPLLEREFLSVFGLSQKC